MTPTNYEESKACNILGASEFSEISENSDCRETAGLPSGHKKRESVGSLFLTLSGRGGGYLLFHFRSIIGVARFNFSVRNGKRWSPCAIATLVSFTPVASNGPAAV